MALARRHPAAQPPSRDDAGRDRRPAGPRFPAARVAHAAGRRQGTGPGSPAAPAPRPGGLLHRPLRLRQVDDRPQPGRRHAGERRPDHHPARRRRGAPRADRRPRLQQGRPGRERAPDRLGRGRGGPAPRHGGGLPDRTVRGGARGGPPDGGGGRSRVRPGARGHPAGGLRATGPQGSLRPGTCRAAARDDRDRRPVRGARQRRVDHRHHHHDRAGGGRGRAAHLVENGWVEPKLA